MGERSLRVGLALDTSSPPEKLTELIQFLETENCHVTIWEQSGNPSASLLAGWKETPDVIFLYFSENTTHAVSLIEIASLRGQATPKILIVDNFCQKLRKKALGAQANDMLGLNEITPALLRHVLGQSIELTETKAALQYRLDFDKLITLISTSFISLPVERIDSAIAEALELIGRYADVDRAFILERTEEDTFKMTYEWHHESIAGASPYYAANPLRIDDDLLMKVKRGQALQISRIDDIPSDAPLLRSLFEERGVTSCLTTPLGAGDSLRGLLGFSMQRKTRSWSPDFIALLEICGQIFLNALQKKDVENALRESEFRFRSLVENLGEGVIFCDRDDNILHVNSRFLEMTGYEVAEVLGNRAFELFAKDSESNTMQRQTERRLSGESDSYTIELQRKDGENFWAEIHATPMRSSIGEIVGTLGAVTNINQRVQVLNALKDSEKKYRDLVESSRDLIWSVNAEGDWTFVNQASRRIYGREPAELLGRPFADLFTPEQADKDLKIFEEVLLEGKVISDYETEHLHRDGSKVRLSFNARAIHGADGAVLGASGTAADITARKLAEEELRNQREFFKLIIDANPNFIFVKDSHGCLSLANRAVSDFCGIPPEELIGKSSFDLAVDPEEAERFRQQDLRILSTGESMHIQEEKLTSLVNGHSKWFETIKKPLFDELGRPNQILGISTDLTDRKLAEDALRAVVEGTVTTTANDFFRSLVEHLATALGAAYSWIALHSKANAEEFEVLAHWLHGSIGPPHSYHKAGSLSESAIKHGFRYVSSNLQQKHTRSKFFNTHSFESAAVIPVYNSHGEPLGVMGVLHTSKLDDSRTARYLLEIFAGRAGAEIERLQAERDRSKLQQQLTQSQKMEAIGQLAAGIAHDLNNALGAVVGHLQLMKLEPSLPAPLTESLNISLNGCERATSLIEHLLGFSRQGKYNPQKISLRKSLKETLKFLRHVISKNIAIEISECDDDLYVSADPNQVQQALTNLIINAQQAIEIGYGKISFEFVSEDVSFAERFNPSARSGTYVALKVKDSGKGISEEDLSKIFEPFYTTKSDQQGTGLGLAMVYGIMQNHGGWVSAESQKGYGAVFSLYFPETEAQLSLVKPEPRKEEIKARGTVMVVDDETFLVDLAIRFLERSGFQAHGFTSGEEALEWYTQNHSLVDLTILDMKMPGLDGTACFEAIREIDAQARVVILSGFIQDEAAQRMLNAGALQFFQKPLRYQDLMEWISSELSVEKTTPADKIVNE